MKNFENMIESIEMANFAIAQNNEEIVLSAIDALVCVVENKLNEYMHTEKVFRNSAVKGDTCYVATRQILQKEVADEVVDRFIQSCVSLMNSRVKVSIKMQYDEFTNAADFMITIKFPTKRFMDILVWGNK